MGLTEQDARHLLAAGFSVQVIHAMGDIADKQNLSLGGFWGDRASPHLAGLFDGTDPRLIVHRTLTYPESLMVWASLPSGTLVEAWTDGSGVAADLAVGSAAIMIAPGQPLDKAHICSHSTQGPATSQVAELTAVALALANCPRTDLKLHLRSDSAYSLGIVDVAQGWEPKKNKELVFAIRRHLELRPASLEHVPGHAGVPGNELADKHAGLARRKRAIS